MSFTPNTLSDYKGSVRAASTGNVDISSPGATIDGVSMAVGDRVLLKDQTTGSQNGLYEWEGAATAMRRAPDANQSAELTAGLMVTVEEGATNADTTWIITTDDPITVDSTAITFSQISGGGGVAELEPAYRRSWFGV